MSGEEEIIEVTIDMAELKKMKVQELKKKVAELGLATKGTKAELLARVEKYLHEQEEEEELLDEGEDDAQAEEEEEGQDEEEEEEEVAESKPEPEAVKESEAGAGAEETKAEAKVESEKEPAISPAPLIKKGTVSVSHLTSSHAERLAQRTAKFGLTSSDEAKKVARAERFGTTLDNYAGLGKRPAATEEQLEKLKKRSDRFGSSVSPVVVAVEDEEKKKKRSERFGLTATELCTDERKKLRAARFGTS